MVDLTSACAAVVLAILLGMVVGIFIGRRPAPPAPAEHTIIVVVRSAGKGRDPLTRLRQELVQFPANSRN